MPPPVADEGVRDGVKANEESGAIPITRSKLKDAGQYIYLRFINGKGIPAPRAHLYGRLAQSVEHLTLNQGVQGSSP